MYIHWGEIKRKMEAKEGNRLSGKPRRRWWANIKMSSQVFVCLPTGQ
jgi:hypothetical protein